MSVRLLIGDCRAVLKTLDAGIVQTCVTSPPYWRQRDYGMAGQLGLEETPEEYIANLVAIFSDVRRVLRDDGTLFINIGDKWASGGNGGGGSYMADRGEAWAHAKDARGWLPPPAGYKDKDLIGLPWMLAFALRADGWYLRQCNIWAKPNGMPESVSDRTTVSHEYVLHLSKSPRYFYNIDAARTPPAPSTETRLAQNVDEQDGSDRANGNSRPERPLSSVSRGLHGSTLQGSPHGRHAENGFPTKERSTDKQRGHGRVHAGFNDRWDAMEKCEQQANGSNLRSVWWISPAQCKEAHYAVMPNRLAELCVVSGSRHGDVVLDPFGGAGTTGLVADRLGRDAILIELNPEYAALGSARIANDAPLFADVSVADGAA